MHAGLKKWKRRIGRRIHFPAKKIRFGDLARTTPLCRNYGFSRGKPVDRFFIEQFIASNRAHIGGRVLELLNSNYTRKYGGGKVTHSDVLDVNRANPKATIYDDLRTLSSIPDNSYDCIILTQTLHLIDDDAGALRQLFRVLRPGGVFLMTVPCISRVPKTAEDGIWNRFYTDNGVHYILTQDFQPSEFSIVAYGNLPVATAFLYGLSVQDLDPPLLRLNDPEYPLIIGACARKRNGHHVPAQEILPADLA